MTHTHQVAKLKFATQNKTKIQVAKIKFKLTRDKYCQHFD